MESVKPWRDWYHVTAHVYGSWLRGDPRGWRSRHHREHVDGDYKHPPPKGKYDWLLEYSKSLMKRDPVRLEWSIRSFVLEAVIDKLLMDKIKVVVASLDSKHLHILARFPDHDPRHWVGRAKKNASHVLRAEGLATQPGGIWAKRSHPEPIVRRAHQLHAGKYIFDHRDEGAAVFYVQ